MVEEYLFSSAKGLKEGGENEFHDGRFCNPFPIFMMAAFATPSSFREGVSNSSWSVCRRASVRQVGFIAPT